MNFPTRRWLFPGSKWLVYTTLVGLIPVFIRIFMYFIIEDNGNLFEEADILAFGLVNVTSAFNYLEDQPSGDSKTTLTGINILLIILIAVLFTFSFINNHMQDSIKRGALITSATLLTLTAFIMAYIIASISLEPKKS